MCHHVRNRTTTTVDCDNCKLMHFKYKLKSRYGLTYEQYLELLEEQDNVCAICGKDENHAYRTKLSVDHNHETGKVRGLLCYMCNTGIAKLDEDIERLRKAADYLEGAE